jgi:hypothetical protein
MDYENTKEQAICCSITYLWVLIDKDATALVFFAFIAIPLFFAKENWIY